MNLSSSSRLAGRLGAAVLLATLALTTPAAAQTVALTQSNSTVLRGGSYANTNLSAEPVLVTRASDDATYVRRTVLKFDTESTVPANATIASATLTLTVAGGNAESRTLTAYRVVSSYEKTQATWNKRNSSTSWSNVGGDLGETYDTASVTATVGSRVTFDVTALVQGAVKGQFGSSRYSRVAVIDAGSASKDSYKEYYPEEAGDPSVRPTLTVVYGSTTTTTPPVTTTTTSGTTMRVLQWNLHHGTGSDGSYDLDRIATWIAKMKPDVITLNEVEKYTGWGNEDQPARYKALVESKTGRKFYSLFAQEFGDWNANGKGHLILSSYPIESYDRYAISYDRVIGQVRITVNGRTVNLIVTHLDPDSQTRRLTQAKEVITWSAAEAENRILTGDMNAWPDQSSIAEFDKTYNDSWAVAESKGLSVAFAGLTPSGATKKGRIDYIFYSKTASNLVVKQSQVYDTRDSSGVMASDHRPVVTTFEVR